MVAACDGEVGTDLGWVSKPHPSESHFVIYSLLSEASLGFARCPLSISLSSINGRNKWSALIKKMVVTYY